jgi:hypothetical protein
MPFDQIYWNSGISFKETGESESSGVKDSKIGITANANPHSTFSFLGNRRTQILNFAVKQGGSLGGLPPSNRQHAHSYHNVGTGPGEVGDPNTTTNYAGGAVNSMTASDIPASAPAGTTLFDCQNRESSHHASQHPFLRNQDNMFNGIHKNDMLEVTTTGKPYKGCYLILKRKTYIYNEFNIGTDQGTLQSNVTLGGVSVPVTEAVINPTHSIKDQVDTASVRYKYISIYKNGVIQRPDYFVEVPSSQIGNGSAGPMTCNISGTTITLNNTFQNNGEHRRYFRTNFLINIGGTDFTITAVNQNNITVSSAPGNGTNQAFTIKIPAGSPDRSTVSDVAGSDLNDAVANNSTWDEFTWGMYPSKHLGNTVLFEDTDNYGSTARTVSEVGTRSPHFSSNDNEEFVIEQHVSNGSNLWFGAFSFSVNFTTFSHNNLSNPPAFVDSDFERISSFSSAIWPNYKNNLNSADFPTEVAQTQDGTIGNFIAGAFPGQNQFEFWDQMNAAARVHGNGNLIINALDPNTSLALNHQVNRNNNSYPYVLGECGYDIADINGNSDHDPIVTASQGDAHCLTIWETDEVVPPGTTFSVSLQMANGRQSAAPFTPGLFFGAVAGANDDISYSRKTYPINEFELFIVAK